MALGAVPTADALADNLPAFPGAEGFGRYTTGGRGGAVYHVTKLDDDGSEGSFRWACNKSGVRTIVFDVSGTIYLKSALQLKKGNVTIAGQTAPGDGICIADYPFTIDSDNVIIRFMRFRLGNRHVDKHEGDGLGGMDRKNIIVDHCSISWSIDECLSVYGSKNITLQWNIVSQSLKKSGHSKGAHGYGGNWGGSGATYHHNLLAHHDSRVPRLGPRPGTQKDERMDMRNNVMYNWGGNGCYGGEGMTVNIAYNYYKPGPTTLKRTKAMQYRLAAPGIRTVDYCLNKAAIAAYYKTATGTAVTKNDVSGSSDGTNNYVEISGTKYKIDMTTNKIDVGGKQVTVSWNDWKPMLHVWGKFYAEGNYNPNSADMNKDNFKYGIANQIDKSGNDKTYPGDNAIKLTVPMPFEGVTTHTAQDAYEKVLAYAGASLHRDWVDEQMVNDTRKGIATSTGSGNTGGIINSQNDNKPAGAAADWSPWPDLVTDTSISVADTDGDGIPDYWEDANGLDKNNAADGNLTDAEGYTNLERYMNSLVADIMAKENEGGKFLSGTQTYDDATGIADATIYNKVADDRIYNLQGMLVENPIPGGIYIQNGKKFVK
ncbi:pectate lyase [uncultured Prevotella sp.]|uniref:pectate lyase family protein n=1 Tax=uncultured Prevotella sp. TaxID=159272 RepID=UPI002614544B|nr:pectate lyase [uncultured Prevotella sp.]